MAIKSISIANYRSFPVGKRKFPCSGEFSGNVNVIVGPNGAGKTNFLNSIRICFDRSTFTSQGQFLGSKADFHDPESPLSIIVHLVNVPKFGSIDVSYRQPSLGCRSYRLLNEKEVDLNSDQWKNLKAHVFPSSFPRKIDDEFARAKALPSKSILNWRAIQDTWPDIKEDASRFIGYDHLVNPPGPPPPKKCTADLSKYATDLSDEHGVPLLESSDGRSHFLYLIMEIRKHRQPTVFLIEEPDVFMHPSLQKTFLHYLLCVSEEAGHQFFITTHSPYLLDLATRPSFGSSQQRTSPSLYRVYMTNGCSNLIAVEPTDAWETLRDLGHSSADVLHPNGIIWVEGPSDKIYLETWLEKFASEKNGIKWGVDCDIVWYGGSNLANLSVGFWQEATDEEVSKLLKLVAINPNAAIVVDRDDFPSDKMSEHKKRVKDGCNRSVFFWMTKGRTIEDYIPESVKKQLGGFNQKQPRKVDNAKKYRGWAQEAKLGQVLPEDHLDLMNQISELFEKITSWNSGTWTLPHTA